MDAVHRIGMEQCTNGRERCETTGLLVRHWTVAYWTRRRRCKICAIGAFSALSLASANADSSAKFDAAIVVNRSVWESLADVVPPASIDLAHGTLSIVDMHACWESSFPQFILALQPGASPEYAFLNNDDCTRSASEIIAQRPAGHYTLIAVAKVSLDSPAKVSVIGAAARPNATISDQLLDDVRNYSVSFAAKTINIGVGATSRSAEVNLDRRDSDLVILLRDPTLTHALAKQDLPSIASGNALIVVSHAEIHSIVAQSLSTQHYPIGSTGATFTPLSFTGGADSISAVVRLLKDEKTFTARAIWSGPDLRLREYSIESARDCSSGSLIQRTLCAAARSAETLAIRAVAASFWPQYKDTPVLPLSRKDQIDFSIYGRPAYLSSTVAGASASSTSLILQLDSYVGRKH
jgi:hypothetical protein